MRDRQLFFLAIAGGILLGGCSDDKPATQHRVYRSHRAALREDTTLSSLELLGKYVFFDKISSPQRMGCVTCHAPETGGTNGVAGVNLHQVAVTGANPHTVGSLKPPTNTYASFVPAFHDRSQGCLDGIAQLCGGNFWDGRAEGRDAPLFADGASRHIGEEIFYTSSGDPLPIDSALVALYHEYLGPTSDQALNPMPNPVEQNIERQAVCRHVASAKYAPLYKRVWGVDIDCSDQLVARSAPDTTSPERASDIAFKRIMLSVGAWQASTDLNSFSSKRDKALLRELDGTDVDDTPGDFPLAGLTEQENWGHDLFYGVTSELNPSGKSAGCVGCHSDNPRTDTGLEPLQLYSDDAYHNIGVPRNPEIPLALRPDGTPVDPDMGLAAHTGVRGQVAANCGPGFNRNCDHRGFFRTSTLRNPDKRPGRGYPKAYTHNGWFKSIESLVHFYNTAFLGNAALPYEATTAYAYGVTRCPEGIETERDALANNCWPAPAYSNPSQPGSPTAGAILGGARFGDLQLTLEEEAAIVAYIKTFTDEHTPKAPKPYSEPR